MSDAVSIVDEVGLTIDQVRELRGHGRSRLLNFLLRWERFEVLHTWLDVLIPRNPRLVSLRDLRAAPLEDLGLALAIHTTAQDAASRGAFSLETDIPEEITDVQPEVEHCYYRVAQEALENVVRHAHAQEATIRLKQTDGCLTLTISDDGLGFTETISAEGERLGIRGMQERAEVIGATLEIESQPEQGTVVRLVWKRNQ